MRSLTIMRLFVAVVTASVTAGLIWVYTVPPPSLKLSAEGVPHFSPPVTDPATGLPIPLDRLVRHYKGATP